MIWNFKLVSLSCVLVSIGLVLWVVNFQAPVQWSLGMLSHPLHMARGREGKTVLSNKRLSKDIGLYFCDWEFLDQYCVAARY